MHDLKQGFIDSLTYHSAACRCDCYNYDSHVNYLVEIGAEGGIERIIAAMKCHATDFGVNSLLFSSHLKPKPAVCASLGYCHVTSCLPFVRLAYYS